MEISFSRGISLWILSCAGRDESLAELRKPERSIYWSRWGITAQGSHQAEFFGRSDFSLQSNQGEVGETLGRSDTCLNTHSYCLYTYMYLYDLCQLCLLLNKTTCINIIDYYIVISKTFKFEKRSQYKFQYFRPRAFFAGKYDDRGKI